MTQEPEFYQDIVEIKLEPEKRIEAIEQLEKQTEDLSEKIKSDDQWKEKFTQQQINLWLEDRLKKEFPDLIPPEVSEPRVQFQKDEIRVGFRLTQKKWKGVVSLQLKPRIAEPNRLAIEICSINAGLIPMPLKQIMEEVKKELDRAGWKFDSESKEESEILVIHLESVLPRHPVLEELKISKGELEFAVRHLPEEEPAEPVDFFSRSPESFETWLENLNK